MQNAMYVQKYSNLVKVDHIYSTEKIVRTLKYINRNLITIFGHN